MFKQIRQSFIKKTAKTCYQDNLNSSKDAIETSLSTTKSLTDTDYEFLFDQLLEGVAHGWHQIKILKFFENLGDRGKEELWFDWLQRFYQKISTTPSRNEQLAARMIRFGETVESLPAIRRVGMLAYEIGYQILTNGSGSVVWEYIGSDTNTISSDSLTLTDTTESESEIWEYDGIDTKLASIEDSLASRKELLEENSSLDRENLNLESTSNEMASSPTSPLPKNIIFDEDSVWEYNGSDLQSIPLEELIPSESPSEDLSGETSSPKTTETPETISSHNLVISHPPQTGEIPSFIVSSSTNIEQVGEQDEDEQSDDGATRDNQPKTSSKKEIPVITTEQFLWILQQDSKLVEQMSSQLGIKTKEPEKIVQAIADRLNAENKNDDNTIIELAETWFTLALKQASLGEMEEAIASWDKALKLDPNMSLAWHNRGSALGNLGRLPEAIASFENALKLDPHNDRTWNDLAHAYFRLQNWHKALESWDKALEIQPNYYQFWYNRGCALEKLERPEESVASYEKALQMQTNFQQAQYIYSNLLESKSDINHQASDKQRS